MCVGEVSSAGNAPRAAAQVPRTAEQGHPKAARASMDELRDASMLLLETAGPWLRSALESAVDALPAAVQCQGAEGLHALATLPETLEMATAEEYSAALYDAYTATIAAGTSWVQLLSLLGRPCLRLLHVLTLAIAPTARDAALHLGREAWVAAVTNFFFQKKKSKILRNILRKKNIKTHEKIYKNFFE